ncbi:MAG: hypothetical protein ACREV9_15235 [Burkholderiales bacterium]
MQQPEPPPLQAHDMRWAEPTGNDPYLVGLFRDGTRPDEPVPRFTLADFYRMRALLAEEQRRYFQARNDLQARACGGGPGSSLQVVEEDYGNIRRYRLREVDGSERCAEFRRSEYQALTRGFDNRWFQRWADEQARQAFRAMPRQVPLAEDSARLFTFGAYRIEAITGPDGVSADELRQMAREVFDRARQMATSEDSWMVNIALPRDPLYHEPPPIEETIPVMTFRVTRTQPINLVRRTQERLFNGEVGHSEGVAIHELRSRDYQQKHVTERQQAEERAKALLLENLDDEQQQDLLTHGHFKVKSTLTQGAYYRIYTGASGNIHFHGSDDKFVKQLCATSIDFGIPVCDVMLVQKLMIECDEAGFLAVANDLTARVEEPYVRFGTPRVIQGHGGGGGGALGSDMFAAFRLVTVLVAVVALVATL